MTEVLQQNPEILINDHANNLAESQQSQEFQPVQNSHNAQPDQDGDNEVKESTSQPLKVVVDQNIHNLAETVTEQVERSPEQAPVSEEQRFSNTPAQNVYVHQDPLVIKNDLYNLHDKVDRILGKSTIPTSAATTTSTAVYNSYINPNVQNLLRDSAYHTTTTYHAVPLRVTTTTIQHHPAVDARESLRTSIARVDSILNKSRVLPSSARKSGRQVEERTSIRHEPYSATVYTTVNPYSKPVETLTRSAYTPYVTHHSLSANNTPFKPRYDQERLDRIIGNMSTTNRPVSNIYNLSEVKTAASEQLSHPIQWTQNLRVDAPRLTNKFTTPIKQVKECCGAVEGDVDSLIIDLIDKNIKNIEENDEKFNNYFAGNLEHEEEEQPKVKVTKRQELISQRRKHQSQTPKLKRVQQEEEPTSAQSTKAPRRVATNNDNAEFVRKGPYDQKSASKVNGQKMSKMLENENEIKDFDFAATRGH